MGDERDLEAQINAWAADTAEQIPAWRADNQHPQPAQARWRRPVVALAAAAALVGVVGWRVTADDGQTIATGGSEGAMSSPLAMRKVDYERSEYRVTVADLTCPGEGFDGNVVSTVPVVFEAWADRDAKVWRNVVTYPNGTTRQVLARGSAFYPTELWVGGADPSPAVGCADPAIGPLATEPGQGNFVSLNPLDAIPTTTDPSGVEMPMVHGYDSAGVRQPEPTVDSQGRPCTIWQQATPGTDGAGRAIGQRIDWCVATDTGTVLELTWTNGLSGIGTAETRQTLIDDQPRTVPDTFFSTDGLRREPSAEFPDGGPMVGGTVTATTVSGGTEVVSASLPCPAGMNHIVYGRESISNGLPEIAAPSSPTDDPQQAVLDQWHGYPPIEHLDFIAAPASGDVVSLLGSSNGSPVIQFFLHHDGTGLVLDSVWTCGPKGHPPIGPTSAPANPTTPTMPAALDCVSGMQQSVVPGELAGSGSSTIESPSPVELAQSVLNGQTMTTPGAGPVMYELTEQTEARAVVQAHSDGRLVAVVWFRWSADSWALDGLQACYEG